MLSSRALEISFMNGWEQLQSLLPPFSLSRSYKSPASASLVAQWLRICLPMQGTRVRSLVWEDPTCRGATKLVHHNDWTCTLEPTSHSYWSPCTKIPCSATREATAMRSPHTTTKSSPHLPQLEKAHGSNEHPTQPKINKF